MRERRVFLPLFGVLFLLLFLMAAAGFLLSHLALLDEEVSRMQGSLRREDAKGRDAKRLKIALANSLEERTLLEGVFIQRKELVVFIKDLEKSASESGALFKLETVTLPTPQKAYPSFSVSTRGGFEDLFRFLLLLGNLPYQIVFEEIRFQKAPTLWDLSLVFRLASYAL